MSCYDCYEYSNGAGWLWVILMIVGAIVIFGVGSMAGPPPLSPPYVPPTPPPPPPRFPDGPKTLADMAEEDRQIAALIARHFNNP